MQALLHLQAPTYGVFNEVYTYPNSSGGNYGFYNKIYSQGDANSYGIYTKSILSTFSSNDDIYGILSTYRWRRQSYWKNIWITPH